MNRTGTVLGSSTQWPPNMTDSSNVLSATDDGNPFGSFNKVWVPYGSGDCFTGTSTSNAHLGGLATTGHNVLNALIDHLINTTEFHKVTHVLFSGGSAGGIGVFHNVGTPFVPPSLAVLSLSRTAPPSIVHTPCSCG
jgi:hypothetical protein